LVTPGFPKNEQDTTCLPFIQQTALALKELHPENNIVVVSTQYPFSTHAYLWHGIEVIPIGGKNRSGLFRAITLFKAYRILKVLKQKHPLMGVLSFFHTECALVANKFAERHGLKHFSWLQGQDAKKENSYVSRAGMKGENIIALSPFLQSEFEKNHAVKPGHVIENGIREQLFPVLNTAERSIDILGVGSLIPVKNYELFIELIHSLVAEFPNLKAVIVGEGTEREILQGLIEQSGLQNNITLAGLKDHASTLALMNSGKILLHTSRYEGSCSVLFEALYSGCHVVSTCNPSSLKDAEFFHSTDKEYLKEKLKELLLKEIKHQRVLYRTIDDVAKEAMSLFS
jgi:glycosyltransferase involved in cell wall biosynthesis